MHRIDTAGTNVTLPTPKSVGGTVGYFTDGNPSGGTPATQVSDDWLNAVQEEIVGVITAAGLSLDKTSQSQLLSALKTLGGAGLVASITHSGSPYTALRSTKTIVCDTSSGAVVVNLPAAAGCTGETWHVVKSTSDVTAVTVNPNGAETINGAATLTLDAQWTIFGFRSIGTGWIVL